MKKILLILTVLAVCSTSFANEAYLEPPLELDNVPLKTALDAIFTKAGKLRYSIDTKEDLGNITWRLIEKATLEEFLGFILTPKYLAFEKDKNGIYHINRIQPSENRTTKSYALNYIVAGETVRRVKELLTKSGNISIDGNSILITDDPLVFKNVETLLNKLDVKDKPVKKINISFRLIEIDNNKQVDYAEIRRIKEYNYSYPYLKKLTMDQTIDYLFKIQNKRVKTLYKSDIIADDNKEKIVGSEPNQIKIFPKIQRDCTISLKLSFKWMDIEFKDAKCYMDNGDFWAVGVFMEEGRQVHLLVSANEIEIYSPRCKDSIGIKGLELCLENKNNVFIDWSRDLPFGPTGVFSYNIYRDNKPIFEIDKNKMIIQGLDGGATSFLDTLPKKTGEEYYYAVTSVNASGLEQLVSRPISIKISESNIPPKNDENNKIFIMKKKYQLTFALAGDLIRQIKAVLTKNGKVESDLITNELIVTDEPSVFEGVKNLLRELDNPDRKANIIKMSFMLLEIPGNISIDDSRLSRIIKDYYGIPYLANLTLEESVRCLEEKFKVKTNLLAACDFEIEDGIDYIAKTGTIEIQTTPQSYRDGRIGLFCKKFKWNNMAFKSKFNLKDGDVQLIGSITKEGKQVLFLVKMNVKNRALPRCKYTTGIDRLDLSLKNENDVFIDWSNDMPFSNRGIMKYIIYRDEKPIVYPDKDKILIADLSGDSTSFIDSSPKTTGKTYYYAVTAVNKSGMEQALSKISSIQVLKENIKQEINPKLETRRYALRYGETSEVLIYRKYISETARIETIPITNEILITDFKENLINIDEKVKEFDCPGCGQMIRTKFKLIEINDNNDNLENTVVKRIIKYYYSFKYLASPTMDEIIDYLSNNLGKKIILLASTDILVECGTEASINDKIIDFKVTPQSQRDGTITWKYSFKYDNAVYEGETYAKNGGIAWCKGVINKMGKNSKKEIVLLASANLFDKTPPICEHSAEIKNIKLRLKDNFDVVIDLSKDLPTGANGIYRYNIYRDEKPIKYHDKDKIIINDLSEGYTFFVDSSPKMQGKDYYYAVTAINASGMEQEMSKPVSIKILKENVSAEPTEGLKSVKYRLMYDPVDEFIRQIQYYVPKEGKAETDPITNELVVYGKAEFFEKTDKNIFDDPIAYEKVAFEKASPSEKLEMLIKELDNPNRKADCARFEYMKVELPKSKEKDNDFLRKLNDYIFGRNEQRNYVKTKKDICDFIAKEYNPDDIKIECGFTEGYNSFLIKEKELSLKMYEKSYYNNKDGMDLIYKTADNSEKRTTFEILSQDKNNFMEYFINNNKIIILLVNSYMVKSNPIPPQCKNHPGNCDVDIKLDESFALKKNFIKLDWSKDAPVHQYGIYKYKVYCNSKLICDNLVGTQTYFYDISPKEKGKTYNYAVTAVSHDGIEQEITKTFSIIYK